MKTIKNKLLILLITALIFSCDSDDSSSDDNNGITNTDEIARIMNENLVLPAGSFTVDPSTAQTDQSITINPTIGVVPIAANQQMNNPISFNAPNGNVNAVGMRFGTTGPIYFVPVDTGGATSGTGTFSFLLQAGICEDLSNICHDIRCYEFARTGAGNISAANIRDVAMICGNCDEPSCSGLVDPSDCGGSGLEGQDGNPRFNLQWTGDGDLDLYVKDPSGEVIYYSNSTSASGGELDIDCTCGCTNGNNENIFWGAGGPSGNYEYWVEYFSSCSSGSSASYTLRVFNNGNTVTTKTGNLSTNNSETQHWNYNH